MSRISRHLAALLGSLVMAVGSAGIADATSPVVASASCPTGWRDTTSVPTLDFQDVNVLGPSSAWAGGAIVSALARRQPAAAHWNGTAWVTTPGAAAGNDVGFGAIAAFGPTNLWAAGFAFNGQQVRPILQHGNGTSWTPRAVTVPGITNALLIDVDSTPTGSAWAVGYSIAAGGAHRPLALRWDGTAWVARSPSLGAGVAATLTGVSVSTSMAWAVGYTVGNGRPHALILRHAAGGWTTQAVPALPDAESMLSHVDMRTPTDGWAVGQSGDGDRTHPLVLHWNGLRWTRVVGPAVTTRYLFLTGVSAVASNSIWVSGTYFDAALGSFRSLAARHDATGWLTLADPSHAPTLTSVDGNPLGAGWVVGDSVLTRLCDPAAGAAAVGGSAGPAGSGGANGGLPPGRTGEAQPLPPVGPSGVTDLEDADTELPRQPTNLVPATAIGAPVPPVGYTLRDVASQAGIGGVTSTYKGTVADFDGNGTPDLFVSHHFDTGAFYLNRGGTFVAVDPGAFPRLDRHTCVAGRLDGSVLPDLFCAVGGVRGSGFKTNELWRDPGALGPVNVAVARGLGDPIGRGRDPALLDANGDGLLDVFIGNSPVRTDGLPSPNRLFLNAGGGTFKAAPAAGLDTNSGSNCAKPVDYNRDGRTDLLVCTRERHDGGVDGPRLFKNLGGRFVDVTAAAGIAALGDMDAAFADLNGDGLPDLIQLSPTRIRVSLQQAGRFVPAWERTLANGRSLATLDVNGDGDRDIFIVCGTAKANTRDFLLQNRGDGRSFISVIVPQATTGGADVALTIDHDGNGLDDLVVLNGLTVKGPTELIASFRAAAPPPGP